MNKSDLIKAIASKCDCSNAKVAEILDCFTATVADTLSSGDDVVLVGFGTFKVSARSARTGRNPRTGASIDIPASKVPVFKAGKKLKDTVN